MAEGKKAGIEAGENVDFAWRPNATPKSAWKKLQALSHRLRHGVKQTLILGLSVQSSAATAGKDQNCDLDRRVDSGSSNGSR